MNKPQHLPIEHKQGTCLTTGSHLGYQIGRYEIAPGEIIGAFFMENCKITHRPRHSRKRTSGGFFIGNPIMSNDPWKHRSQGMKCATCMWNVTKVIPSVDDPLGQDSQSTKLGRCRRHAPTMNGYPAVFGDDWCGDHKLDETKI